MLISILAFVLKCCAEILQGIICECCVYRCSINEMREYCGEDGYNGPSAQTVNAKRSPQDQTGNTVKLKKVYPKGKSHDIRVRSQSNTGTTII